MKKLLAHIADCKVQSCLVPHCVSSRFVLSHYHRCKDVTCIVCKPVREVINKNHARAQLLQQQQHALLQHQQQQQQSSGLPPATSPSPVPAPSPTRTPIPSVALGGLVPPRGVKAELRGVKAEAAPGKAEAVAMTAAEDCTSLCEAFTVDQIELHCESLRAHGSAGSAAGAKVRELVLPTLRVLQDHQFGWVFNAPVNPEELGLSDYRRIITQPMDLGTIKAALDANRYVALESFAEHVRLTFHNAMKYNQPGTEVYPVASSMLEMFNSMWSELLVRIREDPEAMRVAGDRCALCGYSTLTWEPPNYYCNGASCGMARIRRNHYYYTGGANQFHWCTQCYGELRDGAPIRVGDAVLAKRDLVRKKNDELQEEPWAECTDCRRWTHQACALFNARRNVHDDVPFSCPECILAKRRRAGGSAAPTARKLGGDDIPHTPMSQFIEDAVKARLQRCYAESAAAAAQGGGRAAAPAEPARKLHIRVVSNQDVTHVVKPNFARRYRARNFPAEFQARSKCVLLFQELDGVDCLLFGMYVYEYGHACGPPNQRRVYVSYLDSVHYFHPRAYRTVVYKEIIVAYLAWVKRRGFHTAHIWACPPLKGDDYILYCHPEDQKTPKDDRLQNWYLTMLEDAQRRGVVESVTNLYDDCWSDPNADPTVLPYLEGDYWIGEAETIIKELEDEESTAAGGGGARKGGGASKARKKGGGGSGGGGAAARKRGGKGADGGGGGGARMDPVMERLGEIIGPMKSSFIVANLHSRAFARRKQELAIRRAQAQCRAQLAAGVTPDAALQQLARTPIARDETEETDENLFSEIFDTRQTFLNLCQGNHYQFDQLRRAKHSSMMVLYHLSTPDAPKFLSTCSGCQREIVAGHRYQCAVCDAFELCGDCLERGKAEKGEGGGGDRKAGEGGGGGGGGAQLTEAQRRERQRSLMMHMQLLAHASACVDPGCPSTNCARMKGYISHVQTCSARAQGSQCAFCKRVFTLLAAHARQCKADDCKVPQCMALRQRMRAVLEQQQQMDDRRRQHMNEWYRERARAKANGGGGGGGER
ncbi:histone acetylation protein-domain-containing protein [Tribonema minus]|uniref:histone acetyltransferase n=1 Tax=Tribonema minus TaxID=303371 RepID=A0A835YGT9_9STRA|nr:histone acetylation protein-domain-containing protein [Tribonema minus]